MGGWSDGIGRDGAGMQKMPKVAHVQMMVMMVMMMIGELVMSKPMKPIMHWMPRLPMSIPDQHRVSKVVRLLVSVKNAPKSFCQASIC